jgi:hypothetical protein
LALAQQERGVAIEVIEGAGVDLEGLRTHLELCIATEHQSGSERSQTGVTSENGSTPEGATATRNKGSLYAQSVEAFVETFIRVHCEIEYPQVKWCSSWRNHPQAELIFEGLWRSYEEARAADMVNAGGQNTVNYLVGHFYPLVDRLTGPNGPFVRCTPELCSGAVSLGEKRARRREVE